MSHVLIATPGCAGSTLLMAILTRLGMDTGFEFEGPRCTLRGKPSFGERYEFKINGTRGQENYDRGFPYIIKNSRLMEQLVTRINTFELEVDHVYGLFRGPSLMASVKERELRTMDELEWDKLIKIPTFMSRVELQCRALEHKVVQFCINLSCIDVQSTMLSYPEYAVNLPLTYKKLEFLMSRYAVSYERFKEVCDEVIDQDVVDMALEFYKGGKE